MVPTLSRIYVWPPIGWPDKLWTATLDGDMFARTARRVCERYTEGLAAAGLPARRRELQIGSGTLAEPGEADASVVVFTAADGDGARIDMPPGVAALTAQERAMFVLDVVDGVLRELAPHRGWSAAALDQLRAHVEGHDLSWTWASPGKTSRGRQYIARAVFDLLDDGYGSVTLEIRSTSNGALLSRTAPHLAFSTQRGFERSAASIRWVAKDAVTFHPYIGLLRDPGEIVALRVDDPAPDSSLVRPALWPRLPDVDAPKGDTSRYPEPESAAQRRPAVRTTYFGRV
ncbi:hypothetical protein [Cellulomonas sp. NS3]|uniref:hypothetical protein n=1 Tax=Cellulomonas sp. NS3 TaxID=2973977 RepID=UPI0021631BA9|nr:hypothetical protein [Cellulomonas sp. NS3]